MADADKLVLKCACRCKRPRIAKTVLSKKNQVGILTPPKTPCRWSEDQRAGPWNREAPEIDSRIHGQVILDEDDTGIQQDEPRSF